MAVLKKYASYKTLKLHSKRSDIGQPNADVFLEFEAFLKQLQNKYSNNKKAGTANGKQSKR